MKEVQVVENDIVNTIQELESYNPAQRIPASQF